MDTKFLLELIEKNTRVILPEFGAFLVKDDGTNVFKTENVTFSPFLRYNDGIVEDALASAKKLNKDLARTQLNEYIEELKNILLEHKKHDLEGLGLLFLDNRGSIQFTPIDSKRPKEHQATSEVKKGTKPAEKPKETPKVAPKKPLPSEVKSEKEEIIKPKSPEPLEVKEKPEVEKKSDEIKSQEIPEPPLSKEEPKEEDKPKVRTHTPPPGQLKKQEPQKVKSSQGSRTGTGKAILMGTLIGLGLVIVLAGGWYLYSSGILDFKNDKPTSTPDISETIEDKVVESDDKEGLFDDEFNKLSAEMDMETTSDESSTSDAKPTEKRIIQPDSRESERVTISYPQDGMFHIIAGSFRNANYAEKFSTDMKTAGFNSGVIAQPSGMHAVSLGSFLTRQEAADSMNVWKSQYPNIWLLKQ
jgi:nucleoid DNA-binding protein